MIESPVPELRRRVLNPDSFPRPEGSYVLYWMTMARRTRWSFALDHALALCRHYGKPLLILEALRCDHRWASERFHAFVLAGMQENARRCDRASVRYYPYLESEAGAGKGLLARLGQDACAVVGDDFPAFFLPRMYAAAAEQLEVPLELVDGNGLYPLRATDRVFTKAHSLRRHLQKTILPHLAERPEEDPFVGLEDLPRAPSIPDEVRQRWPETDLDAVDLGALPIDHEVGSVEEFLPGGESEAQRLLQRFLDVRLEAYGEGRNHPDDDAASGFSPYLHWGVLSAHEVFWALAEREEWNPGQAAEKASGSREGWWGMSPPVESFLDELITWRELGYGTCARTDDYDRYESLPDWARQTLSDHEDDPRSKLYSLEQLAAAETEDDIWNAAQRQLAREGRMHNYLRMLWGKKVLAWSETPAQAFERLIELNNRYALDGRNPNSYSGISWVFGRYDRAWGPERPIYGKVRYMTSDSTRKKLRLKDYLRRYA